MRRLSIFLAANLILITSILLTGCTEAKTGEMTVKLTNSSTQKSSGEFMTKDLSLLTAINLDVQGCSVHYSDTTSPSGWVDMPCTVGIYNLLDIDSDATVILVNELTMPVGNVTQVRLKLGPNNTIVIDGVTHPLKVPSGQQSGLKINLHDYVSFTTYIEIVLDFDPFQSVVELGNGGYILKPVIHVDVLNQL